MKGLIIISAGHLGREVYSWARQSSDHGLAWTVKGFLDDRADILRAFRYDVPVLGPPGGWRPSDDELFICAIGDPAERRRYVEPLAARGARFARVVHPSATIGENVHFGEGVVVCPQAVVSCDTRLGDHVLVNCHATVGHDVEIGPFSVLNPHANLGGGVRLGPLVSVGSSAVLLPRAVAEEGAVIGAGSVVLKRVGAGETVFGVPAKPVALPRAAPGA